MTGKKDKKGKKGKAVEEPPKVEEKAPEPEPEPVPDPPADDFGWGAAVTGKKDKKGKKGKAVEEPKVSTSSHSSFEISWVVVNDSA